MPHPAIPTAAALSPSFPSKSLFFPAVVCGTGASGKVTPGKIAAQMGRCARENPLQGSLFPAGGEPSKKKKTTFAFLPPRWQMDLYF